MKKIYRSIILVFIAFILSSFTIICKGQNGVLVGLPFSKFYGKGVDNTSYTPGFIASYQKHFPLDVLEKSILYAEAGLFIIGTKQKYQGTTHKAKISGIDVGLFYEKKFLDDLYTPYALGGLNLRAMMKDEPALAINSGKTTTVEPLYHRVLLPELVIGAGYTIPLGAGELSFEIRDNIGLRAINDEGNIKSNSISLCLIIIVD
jgi:hypothetical protein